ncbi:MAG: hypothetical protein L3J56_05380 [Bacteroidales bacterium]|nr:hypothetical protein [Bacteroidales bacterium]
MENTISLKKLKKSFLTALKIVNNNPLIYAISVFIPLVFIRISHNNIPKILYLLPAYVMIGWSGTQADLIYQSYQKKDIEWNKVERLLFKYFKKTLPIFLFFIFIAILSIALTVLGFIFKIVTGIDTNYYVELSNIILDPSNKTVVLLLTFIFQLISLFFIQAIIQMVITQNNLFMASKKSVKYFFTNIVFFLVLSLIIFIFTNFTTFIVNFNKIDAVNIVILISINTYTNLLLLTTVLVYYLQDKKTT